MLLICSLHMKNGSRVQCLIQIPICLRCRSSYFNGATISKHEKNAFEDKDNKVEVKLINKDGKVSIETNVYDLLKGFQVGMINSDILGCAFESEERFENPDGSEIVFNKDFFGDDRGTVIIPGPFACKESTSKALF